VIAVIYKVIKINSEWHVDPRGHLLSQWKFYCALKKMN